MLLRLETWGAAFPSLAEFREASGTRVRFLSHRISDFFFAVVKFYRVLQLLEIFRASLLSSVFSEEISQQPGKDEKYVLRLVLALVIITRNSEFPFAW